MSAYATPFIDAPLFRCLRAIHALCFRAYLFAAIIDKMTRCYSATDTDDRRAAAAIMPLPLLPRCYAHLAQQALLTAMLAIAAIRIITMRVADAMPLIMPLLHAIDSAASSATRCRFSSSSCYYMLTFDAFDGRRA